MKKLSILLTGIFAYLLIGCSGSETYRGLWKATDIDGVRFEMFFDANSFTVRDSTGKSKKI